MNKKVFLVLVPALATLCVIFFMFYAGERNGFPAPVAANRELERAEQDEKVTTPSSQETEQRSRPNAGHSQQEASTDADPSVPKELKKYLDLDRKPLLPQDLPADLGPEHLDTIYGMLEDYRYRDKWNRLLFAVAQLADDPEAFEVIVSHIERNVSWQQGDMLEIIGKAGSLMMLGWLESDVSGDYLLEMALGRENERVLASFQGAGVEIAEERILIETIHYAALRGLVMLQDEEYLKPLWEKYLVLGKSQERGVNPSDERFLMIQIESALAINEYLQDVGFEAGTRWMASTEDHWEIAEKLQPYVEKLRQWSLL